MPHAWVLIAGLGLVAGTLVNRWIEAHLVQRQGTAAPRRPGFALGPLSPLGLFMAPAFVVLARAVGTGPRLVPALLLTTVLAAAALADVRARIIPNRLLLWAAAAWILAEVLGTGVAPLWSLAGALAGGGGMLLASVATRGGVGLGDAKLAAVMGLMLGPAAVAMALGAAFVLGAVGSVVLLALRRVGVDSYIPLAPFLLAGGLMAFVAAGPFAMGVKP